MPTEADTQGQAHLQAQAHEILGVPRGNLFDHPRLTMLDPMDREEARAVERFLERIDARAGSG